MTQNRRNDLVLSEALRTLVDEGTLSEGSEDYLVGQKAVRDGVASLDPAELRVFDERIRPHLQGRGGEGA
jgi:hypothetical protein